MRINSLQFFPSRKQCGEEFSVDLGSALHLSKFRGTVEVLLANNNDTGKELPMLLLIAKLLVHR